MKLKLNDPEARWGARRAATVLAALDKSVAHWRRLAAGQPEEKEDHWTTSCALCAMFYHHNFCGKCPVRQRTGKHGCLGTPWLDVANAHGEVVRRNYVLSYMSHREWVRRTKRGYDVAEVMVHSKRMLRFLVATRRAFVRTVNGDQLSLSGK